MSRITDRVYIAGDNHFDIVDYGLSDNDIEESAASEVERVMSEVMR